MTDIQITDVTNGSVQTDPSSGSQTWLGTGVFDKLVEAVNKNIELQYMEGRITGSDYANVYLGSMQAVLAQATQFVLQEKVTEAQIADINAGLLLKQQQLVNLQDELVTAAKQRLVMDKDIEFKDEQIESLNIEDGIKQAKHEDDLLTSGLQRQQITAQTSEVLDSTVRANTQLTDALLTSGEQRIGMQKDNEVKTEQVLMSVFEREFIQPKNLEKINSDIVLTSAQITGIQKDNEVKSEQVLMSAFEREFIQPKNLASIEKDIEIKERSTVIQEQQNTLQLVLMNEEIETANKQQVLLDTEEAAKQYEVDNILPANLASINKDVEVKERSTVVQETQLSDQLVTSAAQRDQIQKQTLNLENDDLLT
jgi:hypothetical protein